MATKRTTDQPADAPVAITELKKAALTAEQHDTLAAAQAVTTIDGDDDFERVSELHRNVRAAVKAIEAHHKNQTAALRAVVVAGQKLAATDAEPWRAAEERLGTLIAQFHVERKRAAEAADVAAHAAATAEAVELRANVIANIDAAAATAPSPEVAEALRAQADDVAAAPLDVAPVAPAVAPVKVAGQSVSTTYEAVVSDRNEAIAAVALRLVMARYLPAIAEHVITASGMKPARARLFRAELVAAAVAVADTVAAPPPEVLVFDDTALDAIARRQGAAMLYPGIASRPKVSIRYR